MWLLAPVHEPQLVPRVVVADVLLPEVDLRTRLIEVYSIARRFFLHVIVECANMRHQQRRTVVIIFLG
jgi:hypothetical protein